jgi:hypothetical protein
MLKPFLWLCLVLGHAALGAELKFDFGDSATDKAPPGFRSALAGTGQPGDWKIILDEVPPLLAPLTDKAPVVTRRAVLAQVSQDPTDERFPLLVFDGDVFSDFTLTTRFKLVGGAQEQMAGIVFRLRDEKNFYVVRASGLGRNIRFYKMVEGVRSQPIGPEMEIAKGVWHELKIECKGNTVRCWLDGKDAIPPLTDNTFSNGKLGFWTKSDSVSYFADTKIIYTPREIAAKAIVSAAVKKYGRLRGLKVYTLDAQGEPKVVASKDENEIGSPGGKAEKDCIAKGVMFYSKDRESVSVVMPLRDRNGDSIAAARVVMDTFAGQTEQNALNRARPIVKEMQARVQSLEEFTQ